MGDRVDLDPFRSGSSNPHDHGHSVEDRSARAGATQFTPLTGALVVDPAPQKATCALSFGSAMFVVVSFPPSKDTSKSSPAASKPYTLPAQNASPKTSERPTDPQF